MHVTPLCVGSESGWKGTLGDLVLTPGGSARPLNSWILNVIVQKATWNGTKTLQPKAAFQNRRPQKVLDGFTVWTPVRPWSPWEDGIRHMGCLHSGQATNHRSQPCEATGGTGHQRGMERRPRGPSPIQGNPLNSGSFSVFLDWWNEVWSTELILQWMFWNENGNRASQNCCFHVQ